MLLHNFDEDWLINFPQKVTSPLLNFHKTATPKESGVGAISCSQFKLETVKRMFANCKISNELIFHDFVDGENQRLYGDVFTNYY